MSEYLNQKISTDKEQFIKAQVFKADKINKQSNLHNSLKNRNFALL